MASATSPPGTSHHEHDAALATATATGARGDAEDNADARSDNASSTDHVGDKAAGPPQSKRQKIRRHCGRFWLWYLIASIIFLAILLPILYV
jgi:hypothetical protein